MLQTPPNPPSPRLADTSCAGGCDFYSVRVHNHSALLASVRDRSGRGAQGPSCACKAGRCGQIFDLVNGYVPKADAATATRADLAQHQSYIVAVKAGESLPAPRSRNTHLRSQGVVVAVARAEHGNGLGIRRSGVERLAVARDIDEIFALS